MLEERAVILAVDVDAAGEPRATLEIARKTACGLCGQTRGCGNSIWGKLFAHRSGQFSARNSIEAKVGEAVIVGIDEAAVMKSALLVYMVPLATLFVAAILVTRIAHSDGVVMLAAFAGLVLGLLWVKGHTTGSAYFRQHQPHILRVDNGVFEEKIVNFQ